MNYTIRLQGNIISVSNNSTCETLAMNQGTNAHSKCYRNMNNKQQNVASHFSCHYRARFHQYHSRTQHSHSNLNPGNIALFKKLLPSNNKIIHHIFIRFSFCHCLDIKQPSSNREGLVSISYQTTRNLCGQTGTGHTFR
jgi:hypothetical protein